MVIFNPLTLSSDLKGAQCECVKDDQFVFDIPDGRTKTNGVNYVIHAFGKVFVQRERYSFTDTKTAGMTSNDAPFICPDPGHMYYTVLSDTYRYYCLSYVDVTRPIIVTDIRPALNDIATIPSGNYAFLAIGSVVLDGQTYTGPTQFTARSTNLTLTSTTSDVLICQFAI
jgi:hypothetical protein